MSLLPCNLVRFVWKQILDRTLGPSEDFDYISTTTLE